MHWYNISGFAGRNIDEIVELLAPLGVVLRPARSTPYYHFDEESQQLLEAIGAIAFGVKTGTISVYPYRGIRPNPELRALLGSAERALHAKPSRAQCWLYHRKGKKGPWWSYVVHIPCDEREDDLAMLVARDLRRSNDMAHDEVMKLMLEEVQA